MMASNNNVVTTSNNWDERSLNGNWRYPNLHGSLMTTVSSTGRIIISYRTCCYSRQITYLLFLLLPSRRQTPWENAVKNRHRWPKKLSCWIETKTFWNFQFRNQKSWIFWFPGNGKIIFVSCPRAQILKAVRYHPSLKIRIVNLARRYVPVLHNVTTS